MADVISWLRGRSDPNVSTLNRAPGLPDTPGRPVPQRRRHRPPVPASPERTRWAFSTTPQTVRTRVSVVVPTYHEAENLPHLIERLARVRAQHHLELELLIMDDDSRDGTAELLAARPESWVRGVVRKGPRGLSAAVLEGFQLAQGDVLVCMDADLSHPPEALPLMLRRLAGGADFVVGSRYVSGGTTADDWGVLRWLNSRVATLLARPFTSTQDPMSGFFALSRRTFEAGRDFNPVGYKIGLECIVKCQCERVVEIPIHFENRQYGQSKLTFRQQLLYLQHLRRLYIYKYGLWSQVTQFLLVGAVGTLVNLAALALFVAAHMPVRAAVAVAIWVAMSTNFVLNRRFSFSFARSGPVWTQYLRYAASCSCGALVNYAITLLMLRHFPQLVPGAAALLGIVAGTAMNFVASRYLVFRARHLRPQVA